MESLDVLREFGWVGILVIWLLDKAFPRLWAFLTDKVFPARVRAREEKREEQEQDARARREQEASLLKAKIEREQREEIHRLQMEERMVKATEETAKSMVKAMEDTAKSIQQMTLAITVNNERLGQVVAIIDKLNSFTADAVADMRENVAKLHKRDTQQKIKVPSRTKKQT